MPSRRYIRLPTDLPSGSKEWATIKEDIVNALQREVMAVRKYVKGHKIHRHDTVYTGSAGAALMNYRLASLGLSIDNEMFSPLSLQEVGDGDVSLVLSSNRLTRAAIRDAAHASFIETPIGLATMSLARSSQLNREDPKAKQLLLHAIKQICDNDQIEYDNDCEILYGRAGLLYALLYLRKEGARLRTSGSADVHILTSLEQMRCSILSPGYGE
ncbi:hypothetical protein M422DRAFT_781666 [Sphaerobolus stellatus SS14]|uniref:Uncharacterized protein n=1 Tax=Sphaerobolus stellatus (strain SS14) TaxID=990650 RepID=A0A0C9URU9_SPHS4|nr:hypothetical protein M422DRAFT_781666 [Sphaerobolus stellatus SS14]